MQPAVPARGTLLGSRPCVRDIARRPAFWSLVVMFVFGCSSSSDSSSGGCGGGCNSETTGSCDIDTEAVICGDLITVECLDGGEPEAAKRCEKAIEEDGQVIYCCTSAVDVETGDATAATTVDTGDTSSAAETDAANATTSASGPASGPGGGESGSGGTGGTGGTGGG